MPKSYLSTFMSYSVFYYYLFYYSKQFYANCENHNEILLEKNSSVREANNLRCPHVARFNILHQDKGSTLFPIKVLFICVGRLILLLEQWYWSMNNPTSSPYNYLHTLYWTLLAPHYYSRDILVISVLSSHYSEVWWEPPLSFSAFCN